MTDVMTFQQLDSEWEKVVFAIEFDVGEISAETLFNYFTTPTLLQTWWAEEATVEPQVGGRYEMYWPSINKRMVGKIVTYAPAAHFAFTWGWEDGTEEREKLVDVVIGAGSATLTHSEYTDTPNDKQAREDHSNGWGYFLGLLQEQLTHNDVPS